MSQPGQSFWDTLDEAPTVRSGGFIVSVLRRDELPVELRQRPRLERALAQTTLLGLLLEKETT